MGFNINVNVNWLDTHPNIRVKALSELDNERGASLRGNLG